MRRMVILGVVAVASVGSLGPPARAGRLRCAGDSVKVGSVCVDKYEASVWSIPAANTSLLRRVQRGMATLADLSAGGAIQLGSAPGGSCTGGEYPGTFPVNGNWTVPLYALSVAGVKPSTCLSWAQAGQACALSGKRLIRNEEWQWAASGTPDPGTDDGATDCNVSAAGGPTETGARSACVSSWGAYDMVGNVDEWVAEWADFASGSASWDASFGRDLSFWGGGEAVHLPGMVFRGGDWVSGSNAGIFTVVTNMFPSDRVQFVGFRCAR